MNKEEQQEEVLKQKVEALRLANPIPVHVNNFTMTTLFGQVKVSDDPEVYRKDVSLILSIFFGNKPVAVVQTNLQHLMELRGLLNQQIELALNEIKTDAPLEVKEIKEENTEGRGVQ